MAYDARLELRGLLGLIYDESNEVLTVLAVNATQPDRLRLPTAYLKTIDPHIPRLFFNGEASYQASSNVQVLHDVGRCDNVKSWEAVDLYGLDVELETDYKDESRLKPQGLSKVVDLAATQNPDPAVSALTRGLTDPAYRTAGGAADYPLVGSRMTLSSGQVNLYYPKNYRFKFLGGWISLHKAVRINLQGLENPVVFKFSSLHGEEDHSGWLEIEGGETPLLIAMDNNTIPSGPGADCSEGLDFTAHYNLVKTPQLMLGRLPYPLEQLAKKGEPGPSLNAQCSPLDYGG